jgi:hypothetical protein
MVGIYIAPELANGRELFEPTRVPVVGLWE